MLSMDKTSRGLCFRRSTEMTLVLMVHLGHLFR